MFHYNFCIQKYTFDTFNTHAIHVFDCSVTGCAFVKSHMVGYDTQYTREKHKTVSKVILRSK